MVPSADPVRIVVPKAFICLAMGSASDRATALEIFRHIRARISLFKKVRRIEFCDLPKTISGKNTSVQITQAGSGEG